MRAILLLLLLSGCAAYRYNEPENADPDTMQRFYTARANCAERASKMDGQYGQKNRDVQRFFIDCMKGKGFSE